jgi:hypothetical protein
VKLPPYAAVRRCLGPPFPIVRCPSCTSCCLRIGVVSELSLAIETARKCFSIIGNPAVDLVQDPETDASYLVIEIQVRGDVRDNVMAHRTLARETARLLGPRREIISLHYDII